MRRSLPPPLPQHPVRNAIAGTVESIGAITDKTLYDCYNTFYVPDHEMLCVVGDVDPEAIFRLADSMTPARSGGEVRRDYGVPEAMTPLKRKVEMAMEVSMPTFALGFKTEPAAFGRDSMLQEVIGELAAECLMGESSPLYTRLYQENLIDSDFSCGYEGVKGMSLLTASGDSNDQRPSMRPSWRRQSALPRRGFRRRSFISSSARRWGGESAVSTALKASAIECARITLRAFHTSPSRKFSGRSLCPRWRRSSAARCRRSAAAYPSFAPWANTDYIVIRR